MLPQQALMEVELPVLVPAAEGRPPVGQPPAVWVDVVPPGASVVLRMEERGDHVVVPRYLG